MTEVNLSGFGNWLALIVGVGVLAPYPALPVGNSSGLQIGHVLILLIIIYHYFREGSNWQFENSRVRVSARAWLCYGLLIFPLFVSFLFVDGSELNFRASVSQLFSLMGIGAGALLIRDVPAARAFLTGIGAAIVVHACCSLVQQYYYMSEEFPFASIYINPSFAAMPYEEMQLQYAVYTKRSFGLMPEPSAMFASLVPWIYLFFVGLLANIFSGNASGSTKFANNGWRLLDAIFPKMWFRYLVVIAGFVLVLFSKSGGSVHFILAVVGLTVVHGPRIFGKSSFYGRLALMLMVALLCAGVYGIYENYAERSAEEADQDGSWEIRMNSIKFGISLVTDGEFLNFLFGYGPGMVPVYALSSTGQPGIHSWVVAYFAGGGLLALVVLLVVGVLIFNQLRVCFPLSVAVGFSYILLVVFVLTTGYFHLLGMWLFLGFIFQLFMLVIDWK